jgi:hypothetical protein
MAEKKGGKPQEDESRRNVICRDCPRRCKPGELIVIPLGPDPDEIPPDKMDYTLPFWVGTPVE